MAQMANCHKKLNDKGEGKCSVPMWSNGLPAGFCDKPAYGERPNGETFRTPGGIHRVDGKYGGYVPGLACPAHGGPPKPEPGTTGPEWDLVSAQKQIRSCRFRCEAGPLEMNAAYSWLIKELGKRTDED